MAGSTAHPDRQLFDYLSGAADAGRARAVEEHLADCADCGAVAGFVRGLRTEISNRQAEILVEEHPDVGELAGCFYGGLPHEQRAAVAAHVARCADCAAELAIYARAERAAAGQPVAAEGEAVPAQTWELIRDWEESRFAQLRPDCDTLSNETLTHLLRLLSEQRELLHDLTRASLDAAYAESGRPDLVPVIIVDRAGQVLGVEVFEQSAETGGGSRLRHADPSGRFDERDFHALLDFGDRDCVVVSDRVASDTVRLRPVARPAATLRRAHYFIIQD